MVPNMARGVIYHITLAEANGPTDPGVPGRAGALAPMAAGHAGPWRRVVLYLAVGATLVCGSRRGVGPARGRLVGTAPWLRAVGIVGASGHCRGVLGGPGPQRPGCRPGIGKRIGPVYLTGTIVNIETRPRGFRLSLREGEIPKRPRWRAPTLVRLTLRHSPEPPLVVGDRVSLRAVLMPPPDQPRPAPMISPAPPGSRRLAPWAMPFPGPRWWRRRTARV